jgi:hypothetical protein
MIHVTQAIVVRVRGTILFSENQLPGRKLELLRVKSPMPSVSKEVVPLFRTRV